MPELKGGPVLPQHVLTKSERFIAEFETDFAKLNDFVVGMSMSVISTGLSRDSLNGVVKPCIKVCVQGGEEHLLHFDIPIYDPDYHTGGEIQEMLVDSLKLHPDVIESRCKNAGLL